MRNYIFDKFISVNHFEINCTRNKLLYPKRQKIKHFTILNAPNFGALQYQVR